MTKIQKMFVAIILLSLGIAVYIFTKNIPVEYTPPTATSTPITITPNGICGLLITSHTPNQKASLQKPITVSGTINNIDRVSRGCSWQLFEGQAGTAEAFVFVNNQWKSISTQTPVPVPNWMSTSTTFTVEIRINTGTMNIVDGTPIKVVFTEENASGEPPVDTYTLPLVVVYGELQ